MISKNSIGIYLKPGFLVSEIIVFNAVLFTALMLFYSLSPTQPQVSFAILFYNLALVPAMRILLPVVNDRTIYIDRVILLTFNAVLLHGLIFTALLWLKNSDVLSVRQILRIYIILFPLAVLTSVLFRIALKHFRKKGLNCVSIIIIGTGETARRLYKSILKNSPFGYRIVGQICDEQQKFNDIEWLGNIDRLEKVLDSQKVDEIYYADTNDDPEIIGKIIDLSNNKNLKFYFSPMLSRWSGRRLRPQNVGNGVFTLTFHRTPLEKSVNKFVKRSFDIVFSTVFLIFALPLFAFIAILIKTDSKGPVFFRQKRNGYMGREFSCLKFRSMVPNGNCDSLPASKNDTRVTRIGKILRRTSLDELPQFWNVLVGDMSVVGPRPHMVSQTENYSRVLADYTIRHMVKPGITGWSQINGLRGTATHLSQMRNRVEHDIWYMDNWTLILDAKIIARTIFNVLFLREENAY